MKDWQRGYELAELQRYAALFRDRHKPLVHGAFGLTKERDIAASLAANELVYSMARFGGLLVVTACALTHRLKSGSKHRDFAGREIAMCAGDIVVGAFACIDAEAGARVLDAMVRRTPRIWVEAFEEDDTARAALLKTGYTYAATKVMAGSEVKGIYSSSIIGVPTALPAAELATLEVCRPGFASDDEIAGALAEVRAFEAAGPMWAQHYSSYNKRQSWTAVALRGYDQADPSFIVAPREMSKSWKAENPQRMTATAQWTVASPHFPTSLAIVKRIPGGFDRVRFMRLAQKGELTRHADITDRDAGIADGKIARLHIPLLTHDAVQFVGWDSRGRRIERKLPAGALCYLDQRKPHAVRNESDAERIHIVADVVSSPELRRMLFEVPT